MYLFLKEYKKSKEYIENPLSFMPLHYAALENAKEMIEILLSKGEDVNEKDIHYQNLKISF